MAESGSLPAGEIAAQASALAEHLQRSGVQFLPAARTDSAERLGELFAQSDKTQREPEDVPESKSRKPIGPAVAPEPAKSEPVKSVQVKSVPVTLVDPAQESYPGQPLTVVDRQSALDQMAAEVAACTRCQILADCRTHTVFGEGSPNPRVVFFGEGPGADEDRSGRPFVGKAGQLLTKMIEACTFRREDVYILNTVKCRPPGNRNPEPDEIDNCREYYQRQLSILRPEYIVCLGAVSSQTLLQSKLSVGRLRGRLHRYFESKVLVTYHPAYLLRTPAAKKATWEDLQLMLRDAGIEPRAT